MKCKKSISITNQFISIYWCFSCSATPIGNLFHNSMKAMHNFSRENITCMQVATPYQHMPIINWFGSLMPFVLLAFFFLILATIKHSITVKTSMRNVVKLRAKKLGECRRKVKKTKEQNSMGKFLSFEVKFSWFSWNFWHVYLRFLDETDRTKGK